MHIDQRELVWEWCLAGGPGMGSSRRSGNGRAWEGDYEMIYFQELTMRELLTWIFIYSGKRGGFWGAEVGREEEEQDKSGVPIPDYIIISIH